MPKLIVNLFSFSYKGSIPGTDMGHGGGFYFDCRCLPNPGREAAFKSMTGLDPEVIAYLSQLPETEKFWTGVKSLVDQAVDNYIKRGFDSLVIGFGCTGGQHRSVYFAERLAAVLRERGDIEVKIEHSRRNHWPTPDGEGG